MRYTFKDSNYLKLALTHRSFNKVNNERLEFIGDSVLNLIISEILYFKFPQSQEGNLTILRSKLVNRNSLFKLAKKFNLGNYLYLGLGEIISGGKNRSSILANAMESIIGAIYLDGGIYSIKNCLLIWYNFCKIKPHNNYKNIIQEILQFYQFNFHIYTCFYKNEKCKNKLFKIICKIDFLTKSVIKYGLNKRIAEKTTAKIVFKNIKKYTNIKFKIKKQ
ncbi:Ribonuclease 3 [Candidatus Johnevansia muelleri]|uniref:Ribonuclease 3 n=1 Tax=Candidatus Johnevansia muelleri TaxID=1495769 RepID=A0A078KI04_9GAMM|nr:Ribonuclease 3 [Candidatus Evansia muelleri]